jgi:hypothetical protein
MTRHVAWVADEFLMDSGFTITDPGLGQQRTATRGHLEYELPPRCVCDWCPKPEHENYRYLVGAVTGGRGGELPEPQREER